MGLKLRVILESLTSRAKLNSMFNSRNRNNRNGIGAASSYRRNRNTISNISRGRLARRGRRRNLCHILFLFRNRSCIRYTFRIINVNRKQGQREASSSLSTLSGHMT